MTTYTLGLALEDFLPVILSTAGLYLIAQMIAQVDVRLGQMAQIGWLLVAVGGFLKATWKLTMALTSSQTNLAWFDKGMFLWMAVGFTCLAMAMWLAVGVMRGKERPLRPWLFPAVPLLLTAFAIFSTGFPDLTINTWRFILLGVMTIGNVALSIMLILQARRLGLPLAAWLFVANIVIVFILSGLARIPDQTIALQWGEQLLNTVSQGAFLYASWRLVQAVSPQLKTALAT